MKTTIEQLEIADMALVSGGDTQGGCFDPQPDPIDGKDPLQDIIDSIRRVLDPTVILI